MPPAARDELANTYVPAAREETSPSPDNSDDGIFAAAMQQLLRTFHLSSGCACLILTGNTVKCEQKKKDKSAGILKEVESETRDATRGKSLELQGLLDEVNDVFQRLALDYAANEDKVRKLYEELERETQLLHARMEEKLASTVKRDKWREKNYIKGLTLIRKSCEDFRLLVQEYEELAD